MRKGLLFATSFVVFLFVGLLTTSCSSDEETLFVNQEAEVLAPQDDKSKVVTINLATNEQSDLEGQTISYVRKYCGEISFDSLMSIGKSTFIGWESSPEYQTRGTVNYTVYGFTSYTYLGSYKVLISQEMANSLLIPRQVYIIDVFTFYKNLSISGLGTTVNFVSDSSPNCGVNPITAAIGYSSTTSGSNVIMASNGFLINSDLNGNVYNKWSPRNPAVFEWNYILMDIN